MYFCNFFVRLLEADIFFNDVCDSSMILLMSAVGLAAAIFTAEAISMPLSIFLKLLFIVISIVIRYKSQSDKE